MRGKVVCSKCGGPLVHETFAQCGKIRKITKAGKIQKAVEYREYDGDGLSSDIVYCIDCGHEEKFVYNKRSDAISLIEGDEDESREL